MKLELLRYITPIIIILSASLYINIFNITDYVMIKNIYVLPMIIYIGIFLVTLPEIKGDSKWYI